jgi:hypothetical protein
MRKIILLLFLIMSFNGLAQKEICICFEENTKNIDFQLSKDSIRASFSIVKPGFETKDDRDQAMQEYRERGPYHFPTFTINYYTTKRYKKVQSISDIKCSLLLSVEKFRNKDFEYPEGTGASRVFFVKKKLGSSYLVWKAVTAE